MSITEDNFDRILLLDRLRQLTADRTKSPSLWTEHTAANGEPYYVNSETQLSSWEKPPEMKSASEVILSDLSWREYKTPEGASYFHNQASGETKWEPPPLLVDVRKVIDEFNNLQGSVAENPVKEEPVSDPPLADANQGDGVENGGVPGTSEAPSPDSSPPPSSVPTENVPSVASIKEEEEEEREEEKPFDVFSVADINALDRKDAGELFRKFLEEKNIPSNINWENCVKTIQSDRRFEVWKKFSDRKQAFNHYKLQKQKQEKEDQRKRLEKAREAFEKMLSTTDKIACSAPYKEAEKIFTNDKTWRAVPEREREQLYEEVMRNVEERERKQAEKDRESAMVKLADILENIPRIEYKTTWYDCQKLLAEADAFVNDPIVKKISKLDALTVFSDHIRKMEKEHEEEVKAERRQRKRMHRKNREAYQVLLDELSRQGIVHSMAKWKAVFPVIRNDERFLNMQEQFGSNALDLFKLYVFDLKNHYESDLDKILTIMKRQGFSITSSTDFSEYFRILHKDDSCISVDRGNMKMAFDSLKRQALENDKGRQEELRRQEEKELERRKALKESFFAMLKDSKVEIGEDTKWTTIQDRFASKSAFQAVKTEEDRIEYFHEHKKKVLEGFKKKSKKSKKESPESPKKSKKKKRSNRSVTPERDSKKEKDRESDKKRDKDKDKKKRRDDSEERSKRKRDDSEERNGSKRKKDKKDKDKNVEVKAEKLAQELTESELEKQRKALMKQLGMMD